MRGIESDRGHGGLLTNLMAIMCRRGHRNARWPGAASHRRDIKALEGGGAAQAAAGTYAAPIKENRRPPRFPMRPSASLQQQPAIRADGGDRRCLTF